MKKRHLLGLMITCAFLSCAFSQEADTTIIITPRIARYDVDAMPHDPIASAVFAALIPGSGELYNRQWGRAIINTVGVYGGYFLTLRMINRWTALNTDTFQIKEERDDNLTILHTVTAPKPADEQVGLPKGEKAILILSASVASVTYIWGIIDSYRSAKRYNRTLMLRQAPKFSFDAGYDPLKNRVDVSAKYGF